MHVALVITGAPLAARTEDLIKTLDHVGHQVTACPSEASNNWTRVDARWLPTGRVRPDAVVAVPATFNTLNKWAAGINDSLVLGVLNDALGLGTPILVVPMVAERLTVHPAWPRTLAVLTAAGVELADPTTGERTLSPRGITSGAGGQVADQFEPAWIQRWLIGLK
jgi:phosphopantothenoylcysteine synthetase/decarboxylase